MYMYIKLYKTKAICNKYTNVTYIHVHCTCMNNAL